MSDDETRELTIAGGGESLEFGSVRVDEEDARTIGEHLLKWANRHA